MSFFFPNKEFHDYLLQSSVSLCITMQHSLIGTQSTQLFLTRHVIGDRGEIVAELE